MDVEIDLIKKLLDNKDLVCAREDDYDMMEKGCGQADNGISVVFDDGTVENEYGDTFHKYLFPLRVVSFSKLTNSIGKDVVIKSDADWIPVTQGETLSIDTGVKFTLPDGFYACVNISNCEMIHQNPMLLYGDGDKVVINVANIKKNVSVIKKGDVIGYAYIMGVSLLNINK